MVVEATRPSLLLSYNDQSLPHEAELTRRRHLSHQRSQRAAAKALQALQAEREQQDGSSQHDDEAETGTPAAAAIAGKDSAV